MDSSSGCQKCPDPNNENRKRRAQYNEVAVNNLRLQSSVAKKRSPGTSHEIRQLRAQVSELEDELHQLKSKWTTQLPDKRTLSKALQSARKKYEVDQTEVAHHELQDILEQQQFMFAELETAILQAPLHSSGREMLKALHFDTHLTPDPDEREKMLLTHNSRSLRTLPAIIDKFAQAAIDKAIGSRDKDKLVTPLFQIDITGCENFSLVSSVFISEIPTTSLEDVYEALLTKHFQAIPTWMKRHFGTDATIQRLNNANSPVVYWRLDLTGSGIPATVNHVMCSELTPSYGMFHIDAITDDPLYPVNDNLTDQLQYGLCGLTIRPRKEPVTGKTLSVTLRWLVVYRYNMLPNDLALCDELDKIRPILNGDLVISSVCAYLNDKQQSGVSTECAK